MPEGFVSSPNPHPLPGDDSSVSSILNKIDSMLLKSKADVKVYEKKKKDFEDEEDSSHSYQAGSSFHYFPHGRSRGSHQRLHQQGYTDLDLSPELVIRSGRGNSSMKGKKGGAKQGKGRNLLGYGELEEEEEDVIFQL